MAANALTDRERSRDRASFLKIMHPYRTHALRGTGILGVRGRGGGAVKNVPAEGTGAGKLVAGKRNETSARHNGLQPALRRPSRASRVAFR